MRAVSVSKELQMPLARDFCRTEKLRIKSNHVSIVLFQGFFFILLTKVVRQYAQNKNPALLLQDHRRSQGA